MFGCCCVRDGPSHGLINGVDLAAVDMCNTCNTHGSRYNEELVIIESLLHNDRKHVKVYDGFHMSKPGSATPALSVLRSE